MNSENRPQSPIQIDALRANQEDAWAAAYPELWKASYMIAVGRLNHLAVDAESVSANFLNEIVSGLVSGRESLRKIETFEDLLRLVRSGTVRRCIDAMRQVTSRREDLKEDFPTEADPLAGESEVGDLENWLEVRVLMDEELKPPDPELFEDRFLHGYTTREIAERREMAHGQVVSRFARAFKALRAKPELLAKLVC